MYDLILKPFIYEGEEVSLRATYPIIFVDIHMNGEVVSLHVHNANVDAVLVKVSRIIAEMMGADSSILNTLIINPITKDKSKELWDIASVFTKIVPEFTINENINN